ncbi:putative Ig domain-containing protein [Nostoc sp. TCL26-01]|uniref:putative Ig domain-containing protein n=1 Tax=Nostoc sp. TCL26-01 TaxID=2576904 RepID=UPI0015B9962C|nr:Calx-beta domain-containing protein [Nostoc sp. TCL26-01]QLE59832.1 tandem-95 repeat protein [Nostoc sp. TCL26-01]
MAKLFGSPETLLVGGWLIPFGYLSGASEPLLEVVRAAKRVTEDLLCNFASQPDFTVRIEPAFGSNFNPQSAEDLAKTWSKRDFSLLPPVVILPTAEMNGANGAFAAATNTIYLSQEFLSQNATNLEAIAKVLVEEAGHWVDQLLNNTDSPGDEGAIFSALVMGESLSNEALQQLKAEDDTGTIVVDGQQVQIENNSFPFFLFIEDGLIAEGDSGTNQVTINVFANRLARNVGPITIQFATADGTATAGSDYVATQGTLTFDPFNPLSFFQTITVPIIPDTQGEPTEFFTINFVPPDNVNLFNNSSPVGIINDDTISLSNGSQYYLTTVTTWTDAETQAQVLGGHLVTINDALEQQFLIDIFGTDTFWIGLNDTASEGNFVWVSGEPVTYINWTSGEPNDGDSALGGRSEDYVLMNWGFGGSWNDGEDDTVIRRGIIEVPGSSISISSGFTNEGNSGIAAFEVIVSLSSASNQTVTVEYTTVDDTALAGFDYIVTAGTLNFSPGETSKTITVPIIGDTEIESDENFIINLSNPTNAYLSPINQGIFSILDDDAAPEVSVSDSWVEVNENQDTVIKFKVTLSKPSTQSVTIVYSTSDGTATSTGQGEAKDYEYITDKTLTFAPGETTKEIEVTVYGERGVSDKDFEIFAKDTAYRDWVKDNDDVVVDIDQIPGIFPYTPYGDLGYYVDKVFNDPVSGFQAVGLTSDENFYLDIILSPDAKIAKGEGTGTIYDLGKAPVLAIRGTEPTGSQDFIADLDPYGVGVPQLLGTNLANLSDQTNRGEVTKWLQDVSQQEQGKVISKPNITGHSLGGALTQWVAAHYTKNGGNLGQIITFNSPGISGSNVFYKNNGIYRLVEGVNSFDKALSQKVTHFITSGDIVSMAGWQYIPGSYYLYDYSSGGISGVLGTHLNPTVAEEVGYDKTTGFFQKPRDLNQPFQEPSSKLSSPWFSYGLDPDYLIVTLAVSLLGSVTVGTELAIKLRNSLAGVVAAETIFPYLAASLRLRGSTEFTRKLLGPLFIEVIQAAFTLINNPLVQAAYNAFNLLSISQSEAFTLADAKSLNLVETNNVSFSNDFASFVTLEQGLQVALGFLNDFATAPDFTTKMNLAFGEDWDATVAQNLAQAWANGNFSNLPPIKIVSASEINNASGAFSISRSTIYLASEFLNSATSSQAVANVLLEEIGHYFDLQINELDSPGDEGEIFAALVQNVLLSDTELQALKVENDLVALPGERSPWESMSKWTVGIWNASPDWDLQTFTNALEGINTPPGVETPILDQVATEDTPFSFTIAEITFTEIDAGDSLTYSATLSNGNPLPNWLSFNATTRTLSGTPSNDDVGNLSLKVTATDSAGASVSNTFGLVIANTNDAPTVENAITDQNATEDAPFSFIIPANTFSDVDAGDTLTYSVTVANGNPLPNWLSFEAITRTFSGTPTNDDVATLNIKLTATDTAGTTATDTFALTVANINDAPTLSNISKAGNEDTVISFSVADFTSAFSDIDGDTLTKIQITSLPTNGTLKLGSSNISLNQEITVASLGNLTFTPNANFNGSVSFGWNGSDGTTYATTAATVNLAIASVNDLPIATNDTAQTNQNSAVIINVLANDSDIDGSLVPSAIALTTNPSHGTVSLNSSTGAATYTPTTNFVGTDSFTYTIKDNEGGISNAAKVSITINSTSNLIEGTLGADVLVGTEQNDRINGKTGNDILWGRAGNDTLLGGNGNDILWGGTGDDTLLGGNGNDILWGGAGSNLFVLAAREGTDMIADFNLNTDKIGLAAGLSYGQLTITKGDGINFNNTLITVTSSNELLTVLNGVQANTLNSTMFVLVA